MGHRGVYATILALGILALGAPVAAQSPPDSSSQAIGVRVVLPDGTRELAASVAAPPRSSGTLNGWSYGDAAAAGWLSASARTGTIANGATAVGSSTVQSISLFGGEITADAVFVKATARANGEAASGSLGGSSISNLVVLGKSVEAAPNTRVGLGDWGYVVVLEQAVVRQNAKRLGYRSFAIGLHVVLTAAHGGLPAGAEIMLGYAEAAASAPKAQPPAPPPPAPTPPPAEGGAGQQPSRDPVPTPPGSKTTVPPSIANPPAGVEPRLTRGGYVFPVYGPASFTDDFGAARATTGWHHGNDIFAPLGAPILAVADGTLFNVGWNDIGGNRFWLRDGAGNEFYYAHLSAFSPLAQEGRAVKAGDVIGFVGATGDAVGTPPHLHFEVHPRELLWMGYDGVINPYPYLNAWLRLDDLDFGGWTPDPGRAPKAGAVLLQAEDISTLSGLGDDTLASYLVMPDLFGEAGPGPVIVGAQPGFGDDGGG
ncbi:MAG TPA: M23 family metallopeptidase [Gaiellaceae bacterium]|nr:M23 family metallopeptidase [Gaiellaceae bacterium]